MLTKLQWNMSLAKLADHQIRNLIREKIDCISSPATHAVLDEVLRPSRLVSLPRLGRDGDSRVRKCDNHIGDFGGTKLFKTAVEAYLSITLGSLQGI